MMLWCTIVNGAAAVKYDNFELESLLVEYLDKGNVHRGRGEADT